MVVETNSRDHGRVLGKGHGTEGLRAAGAGQETNWRELGDDGGGQRR